MFLVSPSLRTGGHATPLLSSFSSRSSEIPLARSSHLLLDSTSLGSSPLGPAIPLALAPSGLTIFDTPASATFRPSMPASLGPAAAAAAGGAVAWGVECLRCSCWSRCGCGSRRGSPAGSSGGGASESGWAGIPTAKKGQYPGPGQ